MKWVFAGNSGAMDWDKVVDAMDCVSAFATFSLSTRPFVLCVIAAGVVAGDGDYLTRISQLNHGYLDEVTLEDAGDTITVNYSLLKSLVKQRIREQIKRQALDK